MLNGHKLYVDGAEYAGDASSGTAVDADSQESGGGEGGGDTPFERPDGG